jgi:hypothetical protein
MVFHLVSFPFLAIQAERKIGKPNNLLAGKTDTLAIPCNITGNKSDDIISFLCAI